MQEEAIQRFSSQVLSDLASTYGGAMVNIASVDAILPCLGTGYDSAKAGAVQFTRSLAVDLAPHGIRVNAVSPGHVPVETLARMRRGEIPPLWPADPSPSGLMGPLMQQRSANIPMGRSAEVAEIAHAVLFLASAAASWFVNTLNHTKPATPRTMPNTSADAGSSW